MSLFCLFIISYCIRLCSIFKIEEKILAIRSEPKESFIPFKIFFFIKANMCFFFIKHDDTPDPSLFHRLRIGMVYAVINSLANRSPEMASHFRFVGGHGSEAEYTFTGGRIILLTVMMREEH